MADPYAPLRQYMAQTHGVTLVASEICYLGKLIDQCRAAAAEQIIECPMCRNQEPDRNTCPECLGAGEV